MPTRSARHRQIESQTRLAAQGLLQHTEQYSLDPNLVDSDFFDSRVNMEGVVVQAGYALTDAIVFNLTYGYGWQVDTTSAPAASETSRSIRCANIRSFRPT